MDSPTLHSPESHFYQTGYSFGYPHGELHGLFEGRELGKEKGWELWEEVGFIEGFARGWKGILGEGGSARTMTNLDAILTLVEAFPKSNNSASKSTIATGEGEQEMDIPQLLTSLRAKYKATCGGLGVRPRLVASKNGGNGEGEGKSMSM